MSAAEERRPLWLGGGEWWVSLAEMPEVVARLSGLLMALARACADPRAPDRAVVVGFECSRVLGEAAMDLARLDVRPHPDLLRNAQLPGTEAFDAMLAHLEQSEEPWDPAVWRARVLLGFDVLAAVTAGLATADLPGQRNLAAWARDLTARLQEWRGLLEAAADVRDDGALR